MFPCTQWCSAAPFQANLAIQVCPAIYVQVFASAEAFDEWFQVGSGDKEKEAEVVEQLHKVRCAHAVPWLGSSRCVPFCSGRLRIDSHFERGNNACPLICSRSCGR